MALTFVERTIRGIDQNVVVVDDTTDEIVISRLNLTSWDVEQMTKAEALIASDEAITTLIEAFQAYTMPNATNAYQYYTPYLINIAEANASYRPHGVNAQVWDQLKSNEARIAALEPTEPVV